MLHEGSSEASKKLKDELNRSFAELARRTAELKRESRSTNYNGDGDAALKSFEDRVTSHENEMRGPAKIMDAFPSTGRVLECAFAAADAADAALDALEASLAKSKQAAPSKPSESKDVKSDLLAQLQSEGTSDRGDSIQLSKLVGETPKRDGLITPIEETPDRENHGDGKVSMTGKKAQPIPETPRAEDFGLNMDELNEAFQLGTTSAAFTQQMDNLSLDDSLAFPNISTDASALHTQNEQTLPEYTTPSVINQRHYGAHPNDDDYTLDGADDTRDFSIRNPTPNRELRFDEDD